jgi:ribosomal protein S18 acetylase RimI-like enzyme
MVYASVELNGQSVAAGTAAFSQGWCSIHGMRTLPAHRGRGLAARVLAGLADAATERTLERVFLQVEEGNTAALALYRRAGLATAWRYHYWRRP